MQKAQNSYFHHLKDQLLHSLHRQNTCCQLIEQPFVQTTGRLQETCQTSAIEPITRERKCTATYKDVKLLFSANPSKNGAE